MCVQYSFIGLAWSNKTSFMKRNNLKPVTTIMRNILQLTQELKYARNACICFLKKPSNNNNDLENLKSIRFLNLSNQALQLLGRYRHVFQFLVMPHCTILREVVMIFAN